MLDKFLKAAIPEPVVCLGVHLRSYSIGHHLFLTRFESPYILGGKSSMDDLMLAILICSQTFEENKDFVSGLEPAIAKLLRRWKRRIFGPWYHRKQFNFVAASNLFSVYLRNALDVKNLPVTESDSANCRSSDAPWELNSIVTCMKLGQSLNEALNQSYALSAWLKAGYGQSEGILDIVKPILEKTPEQLEKERLIFKKIMEEHGTR